MRRSGCRWTSWFSADRARASGRVLAALGVVLLLFPLAASGQTAERSGGADQPSLAVLGVVNEVRNKEWRDLRVGMGLRAILSQLFQETGRYAMLEEKEGIRERLREIAGAIWTTGYRAGDLPEDVGELSPDWIAYGRVVYFGRPRSRVNVGPVRRNRQTIEIGVEVTLREVATTSEVTEEGLGSAKTVARSAFFVYQEDRVALDESAVGTATREALAEAVAGLMKSVEEK